MGAEYRRPRSADLRRGGPFGRHVRPSDADDLRIQHLVSTLFAPGAQGWEPGDERLVRQVVDHAPDPANLGRDDWCRGLRADEVAEIWGAPMEGPDVRRQWLQRADEIARAWGRPLFGSGGFLPEVDPADPRP